MVFCLPEKNQRQDHKLGPEVNSQPVVSDYGELIQDYSRALARVGPTSMRERLSRPGQDEHGTSQTSIRHHPPKRRGGTSTALHVRARDRRNAARKNSLT